MSGRECSPGEVPAARPPKDALGNHRELAAAVLSVLLSLTISAGARADGKFFRPVGPEAEPTIPYQRAIIAYRDGVETLIVEAAVEGAGEEVSWVVPLPAEPTELAACKAGTLTSTYQLIGPRIVTSAHGALRASGLWFWLILVVCFVYAYHVSRPQPRSLASRVLTGVLLCILVLVVLFFLFLPTMGVRRASVDGVVNVLQHRQVGAYDVDVITGRTGDPIRKWLTDKGFRVPEAAAPVLDDYAKRSWCFAAARIRTGTDDVLTPHPLKFVFKTDSAVYPMKLTGVDAVDMQLDLYVVGDQAAAAPHVHRWSADQYHPGGSKPLGGRWRQRGEDYEMHLAAPYKAETIGLTIGHPDIVSVMWPGCTLTHLRGILDPVDMTDDITLDWQSTVAYRKLVYTAEAAADLGQVAARSAAGLALAAVTIVWVRSRRAKRKRVALTLVAGGVLVVGGFFAARATVPSIELGSTNTGWLNMLYRMDTYSNLLGDGFAGLQENVDFPDAWAKALEDVEYPNRLGEVEHVSVDVPGGYEIERTADGWALTIYDRYATPTRIPIGPDGRPVRKWPAASAPGS